MATQTLAALRSRVLTLGTYENSVVFTPAVVNAEINAAMGELYELMADANEGYFDTSSTTATVANQDYVDLPATFWRLRGVDILVGGRYCELRQVGIADRNKFQTSTGRPEAYRTVAGGARGRIQLYPTPSGVETLRIVFTPTFTPFTADGDSFEFYTGADDYVVCRTLLSLDQREERPLGERQQELERLRQRIIKSMSQRRAAEPELLPLGRDHDIDDLELWWWG